MKIDALPDTDLLKLCEEYGTKAKFWYRKFLGLLPEINRRKLFEKRKCVSICEFAAKFGGVSKEQTERVICIELTLLEYGVMALREMLIGGEVSMHKLARIVSIVSKENEKILIHAIKHLPQNALEAYVRDQKFQMRENCESKDGNSNEIGDVTSRDAGGAENVRSHTFTTYKPQEQANLIFNDGESKAVK